MESCRRETVACSCTYHSCSLHGKCCECIASHRQAGELPGCLFTPEGERTHDRSLAAFLADCGSREA